MAVQIQTSGGSISVSSPYNPKFLSAAHRLQGKRVGSQWVFDIGQEADVRQACADAYGAEAGQPVDLTSVRLTYDGGATSGKRRITLGGRLIAETFGSRGGVRMGLGVRVNFGSFVATNTEHGPQIAAASIGVSLTLVQFPRALANRISAEGVFDGEVKPGSLFVSEK